MRTFALPVLILVAAAVATGASAGSSVPAKHLSCSRELDFGQRHYRYARLPRRALTAGARLRARGRLQCEPALVCSVGGGCVPSSGRVFSRDALRRARGIRPLLAVIDARSGRVYVNRAIFTVAWPPKLLLRNLRRGGEREPTHDPQAPPVSGLLANGSQTVPLEWGTYCWTTRLSGDESVQQCLDMVSPSQRLDLPLVIAEPGATLQGVLGFMPSSVQIDLLDSRGEGVYSQTLSPEQTFAWTVPTNIPARSVLVIFAGRPGYPTDLATYLARLRLPDRY
jgi:hypothetical protein